MEDGSIVERLVGFCPSIWVNPFAHSCSQFHKIFHRFGRMAGEEFDDYVTLVCMECGAVYWE
jgi:uncharacterized Zn finger protein